MVESKKPQPQPQRQQRSYAGAKISRLTADWIASSTSADSELLTSLRLLRNRSRQLCRDNDYARGAVRSIVNNVIGKGIGLQSTVKKLRGESLDEKTNSKIEDLWGEWCQARYCHTAGTLDFEDIERLIMSSIIESGEVLIRLVRQPFAGSPVPLSLEIIEIDQLCDEHSGRDIRMGVEMDQWQRPLQYWLYPHHPGDYQFSTEQGSRLITVPARDILHPYLCDRPGQTRGVPWFYSTLTRLRNVGGYEEAELVAARAQAAVMGFIQTPDGDLLSDGVEGDQRIRNLEPGAIEVLAPGEEFTGFAPTRPGDSFDPFIRMMLRGAASGLGLSYESLSRDYSNTSYSSARTALLEERDHYRTLQSWLARNVHQRLFEEWLQLAVLSGALQLNDYEVNPRRYTKPRWVLRGWQWVDPVKEVAAYKEAIKAGFLTTTQVVAQAGMDVEDIYKERRRELDLAANLNLKFDTTLEIENTDDEAQAAAPRLIDSLEDPEPEENQEPERAIALTPPQCEIAETLIRSAPITKILSTKQAEIFHQILEVLCEH
ncbi:MAG: phage portal protein [Acaryochloridaceae cyanobacterium SU_2_1]|nr:phage portal protein [Acaryochloridaceae cyanobacterium SU_2_1]